MKKILLKLGLFTLICLGILTLILMMYGGNVDFFYNKFTTPKASSMIIGDSRSMQGIQPKIINEKLKNTDFDIPMVNYSFTIAQAPIGPLYNKSILKKLNESTTNGVFIISLTPWMFGSEKSLDNSKGEFREDNTPPHNMHFVDKNPNYEYLVKNLNYFHFKALFRKTSTMHKDGWLEENNLPKDSVTFVNWKSNQLSLMENMKESFNISKIRMNSFLSLIKILKSKGEVYLVRLPVDREFIKVENQFYSNFDSDITEIALEHDINYFNYTELYSENYKTYDGHHLDKVGGRNFTINLCDSILSYTKIKTVITD